MTARALPGKLNLYLILCLLLSTALLPAAAIADTEGHFDLKFSGVIEVIDENAWIVAGQPLTIGERTEIQPTPAGIEPGMWADVMAKRQDDLLLAMQIIVRPPELRLKGPVGFRPDGDVGTWVVGGQAFVGTADSRYSERLGSLDPGNWGEVYAIQNANGDRVIQRMRAIESQEAVQIYGAIQATADDSWTLSTIPVTVNESTLINGQPRLGLLAHAGASLSDDQNLVALHLKPVWIEPNATRPDVSFTGVIETLPSGATLAGPWTVDGQTVWVTDATIIDETKGPVELGATVHVSGWQEEDQVLAWRITVLDCQGEWGHVFRFRGPIQEMPAQGLLGPWTIGGQQVQVNQRTRVQGAQHAQLGAPAEVGVVRRQNGEMTALWLRIQPRPNTSEIVLPAME